MLFRSLGVELDYDALDQLNRQYEECGIRVRDDASAMRLAEPGWQKRTPRF